MERVILISERDVDQVFAREVASELKIPLEVRKSVDDLTQKDLEKGSPLLLVDVSNDEQFLTSDIAIKSLLAKNPKLVDPDQIHLITSEGLDRMQEYAKTNTFGHLILRTPSTAAEAGKHYGRVVKGVFINNKDGLKALLADQAEIRKIDIQNSSEKPGVIEWVLSYLQDSAHFDSRPATAIATAVDELLMNAIYDAPSEATDDDAIKNMPRNQALKLDGKHHVELHLGYDGRYAAVTVVDQFGSINKAKLLAHICKSFINSEYKINPLAPGAGLGLATTFRTGGSLLFVTEPGVRSEVTVFFKHTETYKDFRTQFRFVSIHFT
jgi:hypothetical protein